MFRGKAFPLDQTANAPLTHTLGWMVIDSTIALSLSFFLFFLTSFFHSYSFSLALYITLSLSQTPEMYAIQWDILPFLIPSPNELRAKLESVRLRVRVCFMLLFFYVSQYQKFNWIENNYYHLVVVNGFCSPKKQTNQINTFHYRT